MPEKGDRARGPSDLDLLICLVGVMKFISRVCAIGAIIAGIVFGTGCEIAGIGCGVKDALADDAMMGSGHARI